jgi:hypothetical protein
MGLAADTSTKAVQRDPYRAAIAFFGRKLGICQNGAYKPGPGITFL